MPAHCFSYRGRSSATTAIHVTAFVGSLDTFSLFNETRENRSLEFKGAVIKGRGGGGGEGGGGGGGGGVAAEEGEEEEEKRREILCSRIQKVVLENCAGKCSVEKSILLRGELIKYRRLVRECSALDRLKVK